LTTVEHVDRVVVLDGGRIIEQGTHRDLADSGGAFAALLEAARG
jgi:ABC-type multidrug transport system fused ATPase/permease subunit